MASAMFSMANEEIEKLTFEFDVANLTQETQSEDATEEEIIAEKRRTVLMSVLKTLFNQKKLTSLSAIDVQSMISTTNECFTYLVNHNICTESWDPVFVHILFQKLDPETQKAWREFEEAFKGIPEWDDFKKFLETRVSTPDMNTANARKKKSKAGIVCHKQKCILCGERHSLGDCELFIMIETSIRLKYVTKQRLCLVCLAPGHVAEKCSVKESCPICDERHHNLLHVIKETDNDDKPGISRFGITLLATAMVAVKARNGNTISLRALIDQGSQVTFISEKAAKMLKLKRQLTKGSVTGVTSTKSQIQHSVKLVVISQCDQTFCLQIQAYVMTTSLPGKMPDKAIIPKKWPHLKGLYLADPTFLKPGPVDMLLGVNEYALIVEQGIAKGPPNTPCAQKTTLGWILFGHVRSKPQKR